MKARRVYGLIWASLGAALLAGGAGAEAEGAGRPAEPEAQELVPRCGVPTPLLIDDFEDGDAVTPDGLGGWYVGPPPQVPSDAADLPVRGGPGRSRFAAQSSSPGGPDTQAYVGASFGCARDVRRLSGYRFAIQGSGSFYAKVVTPATTSVENGGSCVEEDADPTTTNCSDHYSTEEPLTLPDERWYECSIRFDDLDQLGWGTYVKFDREAVTGVEIAPEGGTSFDLTFDDVRFAAHVPRTGCRPLARRSPWHQHHRR